MSGCVAAVPRIEACSCFDRGTRGKLAGMSDDPKASLIRPIADAALVVTKGAVEGAGALLSRICLPAAEEFGLLLKDRVSAWRQRNTVAILSQTQARLDQYQPNANVQAHPRIVYEVLTHGAWSDDKTVQEMWGGLLAASCDSEGRDDGNLIFTTLLSQLTSLQARVLKHSCEHTRYCLTSTGLITPREALNADITTLRSITGIDDTNRIDFELDRLHDLGLIGRGFSVGGSFADIASTALAANMYVKCLGYKGAAVEYFKVADSVATGAPPG